MGEAAGAAEPAEARWGTAVALAFAVLFLSVFNAVALVVLPLAVLLAGLPSERRWKHAALGALLALVAAVVSAGPLGGLSVGWALLLGGGFLLATQTRPGWGVFERALAAVASALVVGLALLAAGGSLAALDALVREHFANASALALESFGNRFENPELAADWRTAMERVARLQWMLFPGVLVLESLAALALAAWWGGRIRGGDLRLRLGRLREFRFDDQLVWLLIVGLALVVAPLGALLTRIGYNALLVMGVLYGLRGIGVFMFLAGASPSLLLVVVTVLFSIFLYPLVLTAAVLVGLGDTWLDVRGRAALASRA